MSSRPRGQKGPGHSPPRPAALDAATAFVDRRFPECLVAMLAGSVIRGGATDSSDLDIVVITPDEGVSRWATFREDGWPIEIFAHTPESYPDAFASDIMKRWPLLPLLCRDGVVLRDRDGMARRIKVEAQALLDAGPAPLSDEEVAEYRYNLTWTLEDLEGVEEPSEALLMAGYVVHTAISFLLAHHRRWLGRGKWLPRELRRFDPEWSDRLTHALDTFRRTGDRAEIVQFGDAVLQLVGGRRFEGRSGSGG